MLVSSFSSAPFDHPTMTFLAATRLTIQPLITCCQSAIHPHRHAATPNTTHIPILLPCQHIPLPHPSTITVVPIRIRQLHASRTVIPLYLHQPTLLIISKHPCITVRLFPPRQSALQVPSVCPHPRVRAPTSPQTQTISYLCLKKLSTIDIKNIQIIRAT